MQYFKQCRLQYATQEKEVAWIPEQLAKHGKWIKIGDTKKDMRPAVVEEVFDGVRLPEYQVLINETYPLRRATDI